MRSLSWVFFIITLWVFPGVTEAATRYAAQGGSGTACTVQATPCTFATAIGQAAAGDTVSLLATGGNFTSNMTISGKTGPITITGNGTAHLTVGGTCMNITNSTNITVQALDIGPCTGHGIHMNGGQGHKIYDSYIHVESQANGQAQRYGINLENGVDNVTIKGNVIAWTETGIKMRGGADNIDILGNYIFNPMGSNPGVPFPEGHCVQTWNDTGTNNSNVHINDNYCHCNNASPRPGFCSDFNNFGFITGYSFDRNYVRGDTSWKETSGCAVIADHDTSSGTMTQNKFYQTGHAALCVVSGSGHDVNDNRSYTNNTTDWNEDPGTATGLSVFDNAGTPGGCDSVQIRNNVVYLLQSDSQLSSSWFGPPSCTNVTHSNNTYDNAALAILQPGGQSFLVTFPPPLIPPLSQNCRVVSPFTTQTTPASCAAAADTTPPSAPTGLGLTVISSTRIDLSWTASTDDTAVTGYDIYRCSGAACTPVFLITPAGTGTTFQSTGLTGGTLYRYQVLARDAAGNTSALSTPIQQATTTAVDVTPPANTTGLTVSVVAGNPSRLSLDWATNGEGDLAGYRVYQCQSAACTPTVLRADVALLSDYIARGLLGNTLYRYRVTAYDTSNNESVVGTATIVGNTTPVIAAGSPELLLSFEEGAGSTIYDESGHGHNSTAYTAAFSATAHDGSFAGNFSGTTGGRIPQDASLRPTAVTLAAWVRRGATQGNFTNVFRKTYQNNGTSPFMSYKLGLNPAGGGVDMASCEVGFTTGASVVSSAIGAVPVDPAWVHLTCVYDPAGAVPQQVLYVSGVPNGTPITSTAAILYDTTATGDVYLSDNGAGAERYTGLLDEVRIYPRRLTLAEIETLAGVSDPAPAAPANLRVLHP